MGQKQKVHTEKNDLIFYIALLVLVVGTFVLFTPKVASMLFPFKRQMVLHDFLNKVQKSQTIPAQDFWKFREFYSPGSYVFADTGLSANQIASAEKITGVSLSASMVDRIFLTFSSPHAISIEALVVTPNLAQVVDLNTLDKKQVLFSRSNELVYKDSKGFIHILFVKSETQMQSANGFFDYSGADKHLVTGKYWFDSTVIDGK